MTPAKISFDVLRARAIAAAQDASGNIWTDYNLHDPGVTLLEQTVFALTEVAYQADHAVRDLLTTRHDGFLPDHLALFAAEDVLPGRPVTGADLASCLSDLPHLERVFVSPGPAVGLVDLIIVPHDGISPREQLMRRSDDWQNNLIAAVRAHFDENRLLATAINRIDIASPVPVVLTGDIAIDPYVQAERVVAEVIHQVRLLLKGLPADTINTAGLTGATRTDVFDDAAVMWPQLTANANDANRFDAALATFRQIQGVEKVNAFDIWDPTTSMPFTTHQHDPRSYHDPILPQVGTPMTITVTRDGAPVQLNPDTIREELGRIAAARIARRSNRKDTADWDVLYPGRSRDIGYLPLDATLPTPYRIAALADRNKRGGITQYRKMMDQHLGAMLAPLAQIDQSYVQRQPIDVTDPTAVRERIQMLDYLISLQGEEMPVCDPQSLHSYRSMADRLAWQIKWRETYLAALPNFNRFSGTAHPKFGFAARLALLADLAVANHQGVETISLDQVVQAPAPPIDPGDLILPVRPLDAFVTRDDSVETLTLPKLLMSCPWIVEGHTTPALFQRATQADAYIVARNRQSDWDVMFQPVSGGGLYPCGTSHDRQNVENWANRLRKTFCALHQEAEQIWLIEDICLRQNVADFGPNRAVMLIPGWTARTSQPAFRLYVTDLVARLAPAHIYVQLLWLSPLQSRLFRPILADWHNGTKGSRAALRQALRDALKAGDPA